MFANPCVEMMNGFTIIDGFASTTLKFVYHTRLERHRESVFEREKARKSTGRFKHNLTPELRELLLTEFDDSIAHRTLDKSFLALVLV